MIQLRSKESFVLKVLKYGFSFKTDFTKYGTLQASKSSLKETSNQTQKTIQ